MWGAIASAIIFISAFVILIVLFFTIGHANIPFQKLETAYFSNSLDQAMKYQCLIPSQVF
jgi:archaellum component FlaF (FlaF/FlaG flagellin family)